jgi:hypothetical protein
MPKNNYLIDTNILIYHTCSSTKIINFIEDIIIRSYGEMHVPLTAWMTYQ